MVVVVTGARASPHTARTRVALGGALLVAAIAGMAIFPAGTASRSTAAATGSRPAPSTSKRPIFYYGVFADRRWNGAIQLALPAGGRAVGIDGIAPGPCTDRDFGQMLPGRDGATGVVFFSVDRKSVV